MKNKLIILFLILVSCNRATTIKQYPKVVKSTCGTYAVRIRPVRYKDEYLRDTFVYVGLYKPISSGISIGLISGGYGVTASIDSVLTSYALLRSQYIENVWKGDTMYDKINGEEIQFKDSVSAQAALNSYIKKIERVKKVEDSFDNLKEKYNADRKAYSDSVTKCHTYQ